MVLQFGKAGVNCNVYLTFDEFVNQLEAALGAAGLDSKECYKKYKKEYDKLNPEIKESFIKKKKKKEA